MEFPRGITGVRHFKDPPSPQSDLQLFRTHCFTAARVFGGTIRRSESKKFGESANFEMQILDLSSGQVVVLLNAHYPMLAFAKPSRGDGGQFQFVDHSGLAKQFSAFDVYQVLAAAELNEPVKDNACCHLTIPEREQIKYWRPGRVGDLLFNRWD